MVELGCNGITTAAAQKPPGTLVVGHRVCNGVYHGVFNGDCHATLMALPSDVSSPLRQRNGSRQNHGTSPWTCHGIARQAEYCVHNSALTDFGMDAYRTCCTRLDRIPVV